MQKVKVKIEGWIELPDSLGEFQKAYGENIGIFATDIENKMERLCVEALQIDLENGEFFDRVDAEKVLVTDTEWELDLDMVDSDE